MAEHQGNPLINTRTPEEIQFDRDAKRKQAELSEEQKAVASSFVSFVRDRWQIAQNAKASTIEPRLTKCKRTIKMEYDPRKLTAIRAVYGADFEPPYRPIVLGKYRDFIAWVEDFLCREDVDIWDIHATPLPDLPGNMNEQIQQESLQQAFAIVAQMAFQQGQPMPVEAVQGYAQKLMPKLKDQAESHIKQIAKQAVERMKTKMDDQFAEGGFDKAKKEAISDFGMYPNCFIQGPIIRKTIVQKNKLNETSGKWEPTIEDDIIETWRRISPWAVYNQPNSNNVDNGYVFILDNCTPQDLSDLIDVPGYDTEAIREVIKLYRSGGLKEWTNVEAIRAHLEDRDSLVISDTDKIDKLEYHGSASGRMLIDWARGEDKAVKVFGQDLDEDKEYQVTAWVIGTHAIKIMINEDPMGKKNIFSCSLIEDPDNFWSPASLPEILINSVQNPANAAAVALVYNTGVSAGDMIEYNKDRFPDGVKPAFSPTATFASTGSQMQSGKIINTYSVPFHGDKMVMLDEHYMALADLYSGIPRHTQDGPKETATAVSIKSTQMSQGLKSALVKWDTSLMEPLVSKLYYYNLQYEQDIDLIGDCKIIGKGAQSVIAKEQLALRRTEYTDKVFSNQFRMQMFAPNGLKELEKANAQSLDLDMDKLFGPDNLMEDMGQMQQPQGQMAQPGQEQPQQVNGAGDVQSGADFAVAGKQS